MHIRRDSIANSVLAAVLLILVSIMGMSYWQMNRLSLFETREGFTFDIIQGLDRLLTDIRDMRVNQRLFSDSGDESYLKGYQEELKKVKHDLALLGVVKQGHPWLERRLTALDRLVQVELEESALWMKEPTREGLLRRKGSAAQIGMGPIRREASAAQAEAVAVMRSISATQEGDFRTMQRLLAVNSIAIFLLVAIGFRLLRKEIAKRVASEREIIEHRDHLDELVRARTRELVQANRDLSVEIDERQRIEEALQQKERKYRSLFENSLNAVLLLGGDGRIGAGNLAACHLFQMSEEELRECRRDDLVVTGPPAGDQHPSVQVTLEAILRRKDGSTFPAEVSSAVVADGPGSFLIINDITERKWAEQLQLNLAEHEQNILEQERLSLSREVHDEIGQHLTALKLDLRWIEHRFPSEDGELSTRLTEMRSGLDRLIVKTQRITAELRPPLLDNLGLPAAIEWQATEFQRRSGIDCHLLLNEGVVVASQQTGTMVMRIFQEALTNIARHAGATEVAISLCRRGAEIILEITDDGRGIEPGELDSPTAYGIMGMRERARLCRGQLSFKSASGAGTTLSLVIPAPAAQEQL